jgi:hypothetical protein
MGQRDQWHSPRFKLTLERSDRDPQRPSGMGSIPMVLNERLFNGRTF